MLRSILVALITATLAINLAEAAPATKNGTARAAKQAYRQAQRSQKQLKAAFGRLSTAEKQEVKSWIANQMDAQDPSSDPDSDGLDNQTEDALGSDSCQADSDNDGVNDGSDDYEDDSSGVYSKGTIVSFADPILVVGTYSFTVDSSTKFEGRSFSKATLEAGLCVEVEGHSVNSTIIADKIKMERSRDCGGSGDNGGGDDKGKDN